jgi:pimeloyl-ACP methyl ester carboxylesterase
VFAYDRGGYAWSDPGTKPRNGLKMVGELHRLLQKAGISGSIILVGHSYGRLLVRLYASQYPQDAAGIVLVDGSPEDQRTQFPETKSWQKRIREDIMWKIYRPQPILARIGFIRLRNQPNGYIDALPEEVKPAATALGLGSSAYDWLRTEEPSIVATNDEVQSSNLPDCVRSTILAAGRSIPIAEYQTIWLRLQK